MLKRFLQATRSGDLEGLVGLLAGDVVLHSDGGGKAVRRSQSDSRRKERGPRGIGHSEKLMPKNLVIRLAQVNGDPGMVSYLAGEAVLRSHRGGRRRPHPEIYVVTNPEKLAHVPELFPDQFN